MTNPNAGTSADALSAGIVIDKLKTQSTHQTWLAYAKWLIQEGESLFASETDARWLNFKQAVRSLEMKVLETQPS